VIHIRRGTPQDADRDDFRELVSRGLSLEDSDLVIDPDKVIATAQVLCAGGTAWIAEREGVMVAYLGGQVFEHPWLNRCQLNVVGWYSEHPGAGIALAKRCIEWARSNPNITTISWWVSAAHAEKAVAILKHLTKQSPTLSCGIVVTV
jgi:hypothetical protein